MSAKIDKAIVTNLSALRAKYSDGAAARIRRSVDALIAADARRGLRSALICLDDARVMKKLGAKPVVLAGNRKQNKVAIDGVYKALAPDYIMILGAIDVVPHQALLNPLYDPDPDADNDRHAFGDLPYACEAPYSQKPRDFQGPTRVVGRLPDLVDGADPGYLTGLLKTAASYKTATASHYRSYFGVSAHIWKKSSRLSLTQIFGNDRNLKLVPPATDHWHTASLGRLAHFINCHGAMNHSKFYGQPANGASKYPTALDSPYLEGKIAEGTVAVAECCYGGQLYNPGLDRGRQGICNAYLANKAYGFFASTTIAFGPTSSRHPTDHADAICELFLEGVLQGASLGRATLEARQRYVRMKSPPGPIDQKTLSQFNLYGDPSITPVSPAPESDPRETRRARLLASPTAERAERSDRRQRLYRQGIELAKNEPQSHRSSRKPTKSVKDALHKKARTAGVTPAKTLSFVVRHPTPAAKSMPAALRADRVEPSRYYVVFGRSKAKRRRRAPPVVDIVALVGREVGGKLVSTTKVVSK